MYYFIYKTTNLINGKSYIGAHTTKNIDDGYLGSGVALIKAIEKYGIKNFKREIIKFCDSKEEMWKEEEKLVVISENSYNLRKGGKGGWDHVDISGEKNHMKKPEFVENFVKELKKRGSYNTEKRKKHQKIITEKAAKVNKGKKKPWFSEYASNKNKEMWKNNREEMRDKLSSTFLVESPEGISYNTNRLGDFCKEHNIPYTSLWNTSRTNKPIKKGKAKGWKCKIIQH